MRLRMGISMSLDGYVAGPNQSLETPLGVGGEGLHDWVVVLEAWRKSHGLTGGEVNANSTVLEESLVNIGATIMGRNMFGGHPGDWKTSPDDGKYLWNGWWGDEPPFHHPVFVLTHHPRPVQTLKGGTSFTFVTDGIESALRQARMAAGGKDVWLAGGAKACQQYLRAGLVDEMEIHQVPILLGGGERLLEGVSDLKGLKPVRTIATREVTHLKFARR
jgi:dihydrofolate reductase